MFTAGELRKENAGGTQPSGWRSLNPSERTLSNYFVPLPTTWRQFDPADCRIPRLAVALSFDLAASQLPTNKAAHALLQLPDRRFLGACSA